jgi:uncharacterized protein YdeI (BOF family)
MNATEENVLGLINRGSIKGEDIRSFLEGTELINEANEFGRHGNPYSPIYPCPEVGKVITTANGTFNTTASNTNIEEKEITIDGWVARDKDGDIYVYSDKPDKERIEWLSSNFINIERHSFPEVKWEDKKPTKVKLIVEKV